MKKVQCENKHFFDADAYSVCPHCGALPASNIPNVSKSAEPRSKSGPKFKMPFFGSRKTIEDHEDIPFAAPVNSQSNVPHTENGIASSNPVSFAPPPPVPPVVPDQHTVSIHKAQETPEPFQNYGVPQYEQPTPGAYQPTHGIFHSSGGPAVPPRPVPPTPMQPAPAPAQPTPERQAPIIPPSQGYHEPPIQAAPIMQGTVNTAFTASPAPSAGADGKTVGVFNGGNSKNDPVAGWLVCLKGTNVGTSYELYAKKNTIGRLFTNDVVLENEPRVSRESHAIINFDYKKSDFYLLPSNGDSPYINDEIVLSAAKLSRYDKIEIGGCLLLFVPLCGSEFSWDDYINGEE